MIVQPRTNEQSINVPEGIHQARLIGVGSKHNGIEERIEFRFSLLKEPVAELIISMTAKDNWSYKSRLAETVSSLLGRQLDFEEYRRPYDLDSLVGSDCVLWVVDETDRQGNSYSAIKQVMAR